MAENALEIGQSIQDDYLCADACTSLSLAHFNGMDVRAALTSLQTARMYASRTTDLILQSWPLGRLPLSQTLLGKLDEAEDAALQSSDLTIKIQAWSENSLALSHLASIAVAKGNFAVAKQRAHETMLMVDRSLYPWSGMRALPALACAHALLGQVAEAEQALDTLANPGQLFASPEPVSQNFANTFRLLSNLYADLSPDTSVEDVAENLLRVVSSDTYSLAPLCALIEIGDYTNTTAIMDTPYKMLSQALHRGALFTTGWMFLIPRILGLANACYERWDESSTLFLEAIEQATRADAKPELARSYLDYARMLTAQDQSRHHLQAIDYVEQALAIFHKLNMAPFVKRATLHIEALQPRPAMLSSFTSTYEGCLNPSLESLLQNSIKEHTIFLR